MRKSTVVVLSILLVSLVALTLLYNYYMNQFVEEYRSAKTLTEEMRGALAPGTKVSLGRVKGGARYVVHDETSFGLVVQARPSDETWKLDPSGFVLGRRMALRALELYEGERFARWVELRWTKPDGTRAEPFGFERGDGKSVVPVAPPR